MEFDSFYVVSRCLPDFPSVVVTFFFPRIVRRSVSNRAFFFFCKRRSFVISLMTRLWHFVLIYTIILVTDQRNAQILVLQ